MTDWLMALVPVYGAWLLAGVTFLSALALPVPCSVLMITAGGFAAAGELSLAAAGAAALTGAIAGDQTGYLLARRGGGALTQRLVSRAAPLARARDLLEQRGGFAVFLSRWLVSALGPYVNFAAGAAKQPWLVFTVWGVLGELVWVCLYLGVGYYFAGNLQAASSMAVELLGFLAAGTLAAGLVWWLVHTLRAEQRAQV